MLPEFSKYDVKKDYVINCPAQLRILPYGGEERTYYHRQWRGLGTHKGTRFWKVIDFNSETVSYLPTVEACLQLCLFGGEAEKNLIKLAKEGVILKHRWFVEEIGLGEFIKSTGRFFQLCWRYKRGGNDDESFYDIESNRNSD